jgi:hypothetical protein
MSEQIIAAVVTHRPNGTVSSITFNGTYFIPAPDDHDFRLPHRFPRPGEDPTRVFCAPDCPAAQAPLIDRLIGIPVPPPNPNLAGYVGDSADDDGYLTELTKNVDAAVAHSRAVTPLPPELLLPDPDLMASPEGDVKGLRELQDAAREAQQCPELGRQGQRCVGYVGHTGNHSGAFMVVNGPDGHPMTATEFMGGT